MVVVDFEFVSFLCTNDVYCRIL